MIIFFSGTGNSHFAAKRLSERLGDRNVVELKGEMLYSPLDCRLTCADRRIVWVFPTYSWGVPPVMSRFIVEADIAGAGEAEHFMVTTCGDDVGETASQWRKLIKRRRWTPRTAYSVIMPNTYVLMKGFDVDSKELARKKLDEAPHAIDEVAADIAAGGTRDILVKGSWAKIKSGIVYPYFKRFCMSPKPFRSNGRCVGCGKCATACPMENITMSEGQPVWHSRCALCLRCYHICPCDAVEYGKATKDKGQYFLM
ncbi:MAG: EFR1 family ferrodoxin [Muribaculaceae bacterium]|nr:EFR1 family ferrodoxin [Muribaculaceae bacterium]